MGPGSSRFGNCAAKKSRTVLPLNASGMVCIAACERAKRVRRRVRGRAKSRVSGHGSGSNAPTATDSLARTFTAPSSGCSLPVIMLMMVDLPEPFWPMIVTLAPARTENEAWSSTGLVSECEKDTSRKDTMVPEEEAASPQTSGNCEEEERASSCLRHEMRQHLPHISKM